MNAIEVKNLFYSYKNSGASSPILKDLNLAIKKGEFVAIQGPSGSGKSTLLYVLGLLSTPMSGSIELLGKDISTLDEEELAHNRNKNIGFIFQHFHLLARTRAIDNILLPIHYSINRSQYEKYHSKASEYAELVGLGNHLHHMPNQLSGGQQQRVAICRSLMNDPEIILADEPTGNLDSESSGQILELLRKLNRDLKKTVIIITHDNDVANACDRIIRIKDGRVVEDNSLPLTVPINKFSKKKYLAKKTTLKELILTVKSSLPSALINLGRNKTRTALTMIGISVGIAAVFAMITLGQFTKNKILSGYADLGVNTIKFYGYPNRKMKAIDITPAPFQYFDWDKDLLKLKNIFPEVEKISPVLTSWDSQVSYGGRTIDRDVRVMGISEDGLMMLRRTPLLGRNFSAIEMIQKSSVCIIGHEIAETLFTTTRPIGKILKVSQNDNSFGCRIVGVLRKTSSNKEQLKPNLQIFLPFTYYQVSSGNWWSSQIYQVMLQMNINSDVEKVGNGIKNFYKQRYGKSGSFQVDSDSILISQMRRFLSLFTILLSSIAFVTLAVGGIGITNMMLISVSERFREIGLRKALGATNREIRVQFLVESMIVCSIAGLIGLFFGFISYNLAIWVATKLVDKLKFEWIIDWTALLLSICSIIFVGVLSGIFPALKAQKLEVIESLRSE